jgi:D-glycero-D-manno-heptose 1,7-bisphosphate phosphatase
MTNKIKLIFSDRDGTINKDENYYLGSSPNWKKQVEFLPGVIEGIKLINNIPDSYFFILTNQSGVALDGPEFEDLNLERMHEVNEYILNELKRQGARVDGYQACPFVDSSYIEHARKKGRKVKLQYVIDGHPDIKPNIGMVEKILYRLALDKEDCEIFMIGDRPSDVELGLNAGGTGILIESFKTKEYGNPEKIMKMNGKTYIANRFLDAAEYIKRG